MPTPTELREMRRRGFLALAGTTVAAALGACAGRPTGTQHLRLSSWNIPADLESYQRLADAFVASHPGTSVAVEVTTGQFHQWFITRLAAGLAPDVIRITPQQIGRYAGNGSLVDLTPALPADYPQSWSEPFWAIGARDDGVFGIFQHTDTFITYYDRAVMDQVGADLPSSPEEAWRWEEFLDIAREVKRITGRYAFGYGWSGPETAYRWLPTVYQLGGSFLADDGATPTMDSDAAVDALALGRSWYAEGLVPLSNMSKSGGGDVSRSNFLTGQTGLMLNNPEPLAVLTEEAPDRWGTTYMVRGSGIASDLGGNALAVTRSSRNPELAAELVVHLTSQDSVVDFCRAGSWLPARSGLAAADIGYGDSTPVLQQFLDQAARTPLGLVRAQTAEAFSSLNAVLADYLDLCFLGELSPRDASTQMTEAMRSATALDR